MKKQFVTYEIALALKELGFDEPCLALFNSNNNISNGTYTLLSNDFYSLDYSRDVELLAPLWQQTIDWLREWHNLHIIFLLGHDENKIWYDWHMLKTEKTYDYTPILSSDDGQTFKDAREQAVLKAIEIIKNEYNKKNV